MKKENKKKKLAKAISTVIIIILIIGTLIIWARVIHVLLNKSNNYKDIKSNSKDELPLYQNKCLVPSQNKNLVHELKPDCTSIADGYRVRLKPYTIKINSDGFRDREFNITKPKNIIRIIAIGDSHTFGEGVEINSTYSKVLEAMLNSHASKYDFEVLNLGVPGYGLFQNVEMLKSKGLKYEPDLVILEYTADDLDNRSHINLITEEIREEKRKEIKNNISEQEFNIIIQLEAHNKYEEILKDNYEEALNFAKKVLQELKSISEEHGFYVIVLMNADNLDLLRNFAAESNWSYIEITDIYSKYGLEALSVHKKDTHPNQLAHRLFAEKLEKEIVSKFPEYFED